MKRLDKTAVCYRMILALFCRLEGAPTFLVPIINPPFADTAGNFPSSKNPKQQSYTLYTRLTNT